MRRVGILVAVLALCGCSSPKKVEQARVSYERRDSLRALMGEELTIRLDGVRIIPPDSVHPRVEAASAIVERRRVAVVESSARDSVSAESSAVVETQVSKPGGGWRQVLLTLLAGAIIGCYLALSASSPRRK